MAIKYAIHPAIGIARVGDSSEFYIGPQRAGGLPTHPGGGEIGIDDLRDAGGAMKRQGVRYQVWRTTDDDPVGAPVSLSGDVVAIEWSIHVANKKASWYEFATNEGEYGYSPDHPLRNASIEGDARKELMIDAGPRAVHVPDRWVQLDRDSVPAGYPGRFPPPLKPYTIDTLGQAMLEASGSLIVVGGFGRSGSTAEEPAITQYANNDGWFDDTSDGQVSATLVMADGQRIPVDEPAWFICGPPAYAPQILNLVTLYDTMYDVFVRELGTREDLYRDGLWRDDHQVDFELEIRPLLQRALDYEWVVAVPPHPHDLDWERLGDPNPAYNGLRQYYLDHLRSPAQGNVLMSSSGTPMMPWLAGDNCLIPGFFTSKYLTFTRTQYFLLQQWARGRFVRSGAASAAEGGAAIDRGVLDNCVGGAFSPGIEMTWVSRLAAIYASPFRIRHRAVDPAVGLSLGLDTRRGLEPGDVTRYMAVPWQADFNECSSQPIEDRFLWWWPAQRPLYVRRPDQGELRFGWVGTIENQNAPDYLSFADDLDMVHQWKDLGFVMDVAAPGEAPSFVEVQRRSGGEER